MKVVGIIAEYNPFHNGHAWQIREAQRLAGADFCIIAMSGDFVQRGAPAVFDKYTRTRMALCAGADLVLEIPPVFACGSAEDYASCGVALLDRLGIVDALCFGSECGQTKPLMDLARILCREPEAYRKRLKEELKNGLSFPLARQKALEEYLAGTADGLASGLSDLLSLPNNILGIEYCKAILRRGSRMEPIAVLRRGSGHHDASLPAADGDVFPSATALRSMLTARPEDGVRRHFTELSRSVPTPVLSLIGQAYPLVPDDFSVLLSQRLLDLQISGCPLSSFYDVPEDLAARISRRTLEFSGFSDRCAALKTRQYTYTRVSRALLHILLNMTAQDADTRKSHDYISCFRILGFRKDAGALLSAIQKAARFPDPVPMITRTAGAASVLGTDALEEFRRDLFCSHIYQSVLAARSGRKIANEFTAPLVVMPQTNRPA